MAQLQFITRAYFPAKAKELQEYSTRKGLCRSVLCGGATPNKSTASKSETNCGWVFAGGVFYGV